jgi:hypothetical protein
MDRIVANAKLISLKLERLKSSIIQALLLLKQTLALPRPDVPLHLEGLVDALSMRELTYGWPEAGPEVLGPRIGIRWSSQIDVRTALDKARSPDLQTLVTNTGLNASTLLGDTHTNNRVTELALSYAELAGRIVLKEVVMTSSGVGSAPTTGAHFVLKRHADGTYKCSWRNQPASALQVEMDHFLPYLLINRSNVGPRDRQRAWHSAFLLLFAQPLDDLKALLSGFAYLGSIRTQPQSLYRPVTVPPDDLGVSGEYAAQMLHSRRADRVHYLPPLLVEGDVLKVPDKVLSRNLVDAVNDVLSLLGVGTSLEIDDVKDIGFRLVFGKASLQHVGRGLSYLVPVIQLGLITDPLRFLPKLEDVSLAEYERACPSYTHCAFEEPEAHLHPKVQTRLAHWLVSLAMAHRQILVETHSDHLVRRLRGLAARAQPGSELEGWLLQNVRVLQVEQHDGESIVKSTGLTPQGGLENWPADFMDEATDEERSIYHASLDKTAAFEPPLSTLPTIEHDVGDEPDVS